MRCHWEIRAWLCKSLSMTDCWRCASVINICFTFHSAVNINFKHKSKWPEAVSPAFSCLMDSWQLTVVTVTQSSSSPSRWPAAWDEGWQLCWSWCWGQGWKVKFSLLPLDGAGCSAAATCLTSWSRYTAPGSSLTTRQSQLGNDLGMCVERFSNN